MSEAEIFIWDDPFSSVDLILEKEIITELKASSVLKDKTLIISSHRLSTVMNADKMILMDKGEVAAMGTHEELLKSSTTYRDLFGI